MPPYKAPLRDFRFLLHEVFDAPRLYARAGFAEASPDVVDAILSEAARFAEDVVAPLNQIGDEHGSSWQAGAVLTPDGFKQAWQAYRDAQWGSIGASPEYGGQGLPESLELAFNEMAHGACLSWRLCASLTLGAIHAISAHATQADKQLYLPRLVSGEWTGTMCLTEPHAGSDVGIINTQAAPLEDGSYAITGTKIFITYGEHDFTDNIVHLVLARMPGAPKGPRGVSLFIVPKLVPGQDGRPGEPNHVLCASIEKKMGIKASPTCVLNFEGSRGWLVGPPHGGMAAMFTMMNYARLDVGQQGLSQGERALQGAVAYTRERLQMRAASGPLFPDRPADPIIAHADVRRMLLTIKSLVEGCRALVTFASLQLDLKQSTADQTERRRADELLSFLTPIVKGMLTEVGSEAAYWGIQSFGGHGYIRESGMEQLARDARITTIYEGTNTIQANDLLRRKVLGSKGALLRLFLSELDALVGELAVEPELAYQADALRALSAEWSQLSSELAARSERDPEEAAGAAFDYLMYSGYACLAHFWGRMSLVASRSLSASGAADAQSAAFYRSKLQTGRFYFERILPRTRTLAATLRAPASTLMAIAEDGFTF
jgi:alkylation response protein AidB-like acyl-CoA dehydrogenase